MKAREFDEAFDAGQDVTDQLDLGTVSRPRKDPQRVNVDFPLWMVESLDREAARIGVTRQSIIKVWIAERLRGAGRLTAAATSASTRATSSDSASGTHHASSPSIRALTASTMSWYASTGANVSTCSPDHRASSARATR